MESSTLISVGIILLIVVQSSLTLNVALNATMIVTCDDEEFHITAITDGNKTEPSDYLTFVNDCMASMFFIEMELPFTAIIHKIVVYARECNHVMDYFHAFSYMGGMRDVECGHYHLQCIDEYPMTVICQNMYEKVPHIQVNSFNIFKEGASVQISEVEAHTFGHYDEQLYVGCIISDLEQINLDYAWRDNCLEHCFQRNMSFAIIQDKKFCLCHWSCYLYVEDFNERCNYTNCTGDLKYCGGEGAYSVYTVVFSLPFFQQCTKIENIMPSFLYNDIPDFMDCLRNCEVKHYLSGYLDIVGGRCYCMHYREVKFDHYYNYNDCVEKDYWAQFRNVPFFTTTLKRYFKCKNHNLDRNLECREGCMYGWIGEFCREIDPFPPNRTTTLNYDFSDYSDESYYYETDSTYETSSTTPETVEISKTENYTLGVQAVLYIMLAATIILLGVLGVGVGLKYKSRRATP